mgnify:CR=1 FL=1
MKDLASSSVLSRAFLAATLTVLACLPRLWVWQERSPPLFFFAGMLGWSAFAMWAFILAWHEKHTSDPPFARNVKPLDWAWVTAGGGLASVCFYFWSDPVIRRLFPNELPISFPETSAFILFYLSFTQLFLVFAPVAFFARLGARRRVLITLVVGLNVIVLLIKLTSSAEQPSAALTVFLLVSRAVLSGISTTLYLRGGIWLVWWWALLLQLRLFIPISENPF